MTRNGHAPFRILSDYIAADGPLEPCHESFTNWYVAWATRCIATIERERLIERIRVGMAIEEVRGVLGSEMQRWEPSADVPDSPAYCIGFTHTNASFPMGPDDRVVAINRMGSV